MTYKKAIGFIRLLIGLTPSDSTSVYFCRPHKTPSDSTEPINIYSAAS